MPPPTRRRGRGDYRDVVLPALGPAGLPTAHVVAVSEERWLVIAFTKTETRTVTTQDPQPIAFRRTLGETMVRFQRKREVTEECRVYIHVGEYSFAATLADILEAIAQDEGLREAVARKFGKAPEYMCTECGRLGDNQGGPCPGDCTFVSLKEAPSPVTALLLRAEAAEADRDGWKERAEKAEERARKEVDCGQDFCATAPGCQRHWAERNAELVRERDSARAEVERVKKERDEARGEIASAWKAVGGLAAWTPVELPEAIGNFKASITRLEQELAEAREKLTQAGRVVVDLRGLSEADTEELRARRKLDEWKCNDWMLRTVDPDENGVHAIDRRGGCSRVEAESHLELARKLGLL